MKADFCIYLKGFRSSFSSGTHFMLSGENFQPQRLVFWSARSAAAHFWGRVSESSWSRNWKLQRPLQSWEVTSDLHCSAIWFSWQPNKNRMSFFFFFFFYLSHAFLSLMILVFFSFILFMVFWPERDTLCQSDCMSRSRESGLQADCLFAGNYPLLTVWQCQAGSSTAAKRIT